ncbi:MAG: porin family protein [Dysgonamonadaceae bacterium]|jgi:hypothetical protein|nr:porin family protein [Dysgonamonadaceae bacterium]
MKKSILVLLCLCISSILYAQDIIIKKNGEEVRGKVVEITDYSVKYIKEGSETGIRRIVPVSEVLKIQYENGDQDFFQEETTTPSSNYSTQAPVYQERTYSNPTYNPTNAPIQNYRKGYIGVSFGMATLLTDYDEIDSSGGQFNLNFGYLFSKNVGLAASLFTTSYLPSNWRIEEDRSIGLSGLVVGPLFSFATESHIVEFDFKPMVGYGNGVEVWNGASYSTKTTFVCNLGASVRWNCSNSISLSANLDYIYGKPRNIDFSSFGLNVGVAYRLK